MGNFVIICHGGADPDGGPVQVPAGTELQFWVNEGQDARVGAAQLILIELLRNPVDDESLQKLIDQAWPQQKVSWQHTKGNPGQWVTALALAGDDNVTCVGVVDLTGRTFVPWASAYRTTLQKVLAQYPGNLQMICCRS